MMMETVWKYQHDRHGTDDESKPLNVSLRGRGSRSSGGRPAGDPPNSDVMRASMVALLEDALAIDMRCIDAWGHLGLVAFNTRGPGPAAELYQTGVAVAEASLPAGFDGVLPWGWLDNRPFLRCLHGLALCAWRQRSWDEAEAMFTARVWLDPSGALNDLACLEPVRTRQRWTRA